GGMRTFAQLATELVGMAVPIARGVATGSWTGDKVNPKSKAEILKLWDESTTELDRVWKTIPLKAFQEEHVAFGQWKGTGIWQILYAIDNEIHHRGQGYVYLRSLGIEPPHFYDRS
ncbi:MAG TPA: DinB family protein, partial [Gemmatimonadaceae bacterium]